MKGYFSLFVLVLALQITNFCHAIPEEDRTVEAGDLGVLIGRNASTLVDTIQHIQFLGIPYAKPMLEGNRFGPSSLREGKLNETGPFIANTFGIHCRQPNQLLPVRQDEDCLFLNIWTRRVNKGTGGAVVPLMPVIVYVHGGAFTIGNGQTFPGTRILNRDVVFVNFNYRLGTLGFFCLDNEEAPGNAGIYDIITALQWVRKYIHHFGGSRYSITLVGQSAGSAAVTLLMTSPLSTGLFHKVIAASGSVLNNWGSTTDAISGSLAIAEACDCYNRTTVPPMPMTEVAACMQVANATCFVDELFKYQVAERLEGRLGFEAVSPVIQTFETGSVPKVLPENPLRVFEEKRQMNVPLLMGTVRHDGSYVMGVNYNRFLVPNNITSNPEYMKTKLVPTILRALGIIDDTFGIYESLSKTYLGDARLSGDFDLMLPGLMDLHNVFFFKAASYRTAVLHTELNPNTYWYSFDYKGSQTLWSILFNFVDTPYFSGGITHTDDLIYLFPLTAGSLNTNERIVSNRMLDYWVNFARLGNPTPPNANPENHTIWPTLTNVEGGQYMSINLESKVVHNYPDAWVDASLEIFPELLPTEPEPEPPTTTEEDAYSEPPTTEEEPTTTTEEPATTEAGVDRMLVSRSSLILIVAVSYFLNLNN